MSDDLVKRLRGYATPDVVADEIMEEAADRIEQLDASSEGWKEIADEYFDAICERNTRIEKLEAALQAVIRYAGNAGDDYLADQARKALEETK
jgi:hypothetical protein